MALATKPPLPETATIDTAYLENARIEIQLDLPGYLADCLRLSL